MGRSKKQIVTKLPSQISFDGCAPWKVSRALPVDTDEGDVLGLTTFKDRTIYVQPGLEKETARRVFAHECVHAVLFDNGLDNFFNDKQQEALCDGLTGLVLTNVGQEIDNA